MPRTSRRISRVKLSKTRQQRAREMLGIPEPVTCFPLRIDRQMVFAVKIFAKPAQMCRYIEHIRPGSETAGAWGFTDEKSETIVLNLFDCTEATVTHELLHCLFLWASQKGMKPSRCMAWGSPEHEEMAEVLGQLASQFWRKFTKSGLRRSRCWGMEN